MNLTGSGFGFLPNIAKKIGQLSNYCKVIEESSW